jgi:hypothetical protein
MVTIFVDAAMNGSARAQNSYQQKLEIVSMVFHLHQTIDC